MGRKRAFRARGFDTADKRVVIDGPGELRIEVDYDDVDHAAVQRGVRKMLAILNEHWTDSAGAGASS